MSIHNNYHQKYTSKRPNNNATKPYRKKEIKLNNMPLAFPPGLENFFLLAYFILLPYIAGILFFLFYIGKKTVEVFSGIPFMLVWAIGYEVLSALVLLYIFKNALLFTLNKGK